MPDQTSPATLRRLSTLVMLAAAMIGPTTAFTLPTQRLHVTTTTTPYAGRVSETTALMQDMRQRMMADADDDTALMLSALRGQNLNDDDAARVGTTVRLVDFRADDTAALPYDYQPAALKAFFQKRPAAVLQRILQIATVGGGYALRVALDQIFGNEQTAAQREVARAAELRDLLTSLGPFFIK